MVNGISRIIAVPGIGASSHTWQFSPKTEVGNLRRASALQDTTSPARASHQHSASRVDTQERRESETIFDDISQARLWFFDYGDVSATHDFDFYANKLLQDLVQLIENQGKRKRPLHLVGHSTGGLVIKYALIKADSNGEGTAFEQVAEACFSLAFFGVPHYGSSILHDNVYRNSVEALTGMKLNDNIRATLNPKREDFDDEARDFAPLANNLRRIWTFVEVEESKLKVSHVNQAGIGETDVSFAVVDERSATLTTDRVPIGNETVTRVAATHAHLARFGGTRAAFAYREYAQDLRALIDELDTTSGQSTSWRENILSDDVTAEVHLFYEAQSEEVIKLFTVESTLSDLIRSGPTALIRRRLAKTNKSRSMGANGRPPRAASVTFGQRDRLSKESFTEPGANSSETSFHSQEPPTVPSIFVDGNPIEEPVPGQTRRGSITLDRTSRAEHMNQGLRRAKTVLHLTEPASRGKDEYMELPLRDDLYELPTLRTMKFRWISVPCNNMAFVPKIFRCIAEETKRPDLMNNLTHERVFHGKQAIARHGRPHGRYMQPFFQSIELEKVDIERCIKPQYPEKKQFVIYFPYLHWDTFQSMIKRNEIVKSRMRQPGPYPFDKSIMQGRSIEHRLIWSYLTHSANMPLHHRRSLDQYGYPTLRDVSARDMDQVLYKRTRNDADALFEQTKEEIRSKIKEAKRRGKSRIRPTRKKSIDDSTKDAPAKVLMVDTLWMWIMDQETIITCFPSRESEKAFEKHADLRDAIYRDVNGDPRIATHCENCVQFAALTIRHAVTVFLEQKSDKDLEVFRIFEEYISMLTEYLTTAFKEFRDKHKLPVLSLTALEDMHDHSMDLWCFQELRDVEDELTTIKKLLDEQKKVIEDFYKVVTKNHLSRNARDWLQEALHKLEEYNGLIDHMLHNCRIAQDNFKTLLDLKQKNANVVEVALARKAADRTAQQSRAVMTFTVFTVFFLPLSFFTSLFGMNVREWSGTGTNPPMHTVLVLMCSTSAAVIVVALLLAFNKPVRARVYRAYLAIKDWRDRDKATMGTFLHEDEMRPRGRSFKVFHRKRSAIDDDTEMGPTEERVETKDFALHHPRVSSFLSNPFLDSNRMKTE